MIHHDFLTMYSVKAEEYFIAVSFLLLFIPFWRFVNGTKAAAPAAETGVSRVLGHVADWFVVPDGLGFHPGHAWARADAGKIVTVGMDDFSHKLVGRVSAVRLPEVGARLGQGEKGWSLVWDSKSVDMLSPVDGTVVEVNERAMRSPAALNADPYGEGWLLKVEATRLGANSKSLLSGGFARRWMEEVCQELSGRLSPDLGLLSQDGGLPVEGMARSLDPSDWDRLARKFFLT
ncbi:MAG: glycine cleavage system protein H [Nitrospinota bacterium]